MADLGVDGERGEKGCDNAMGVVVEEVELLSAIRKERG